MARISDTVAALLGDGTSWPLVLKAAADHLLAVDVTAAASNIARDFGVPWTIQDNRDIATLFGFANRMQRASDNVLAASPDDVIDASHIAVPPWARDQVVMDTSPLWHVTYDVTFTDAEGNIATGMLTSVFEMTLPETFGELAAAVLDDAEQQAPKSLDAQNVLSVTPRSILAV